MGKVNPKQNNLREISSVERPKQLASNKFNVGDDYDLSKTKPEKGSTIDVVTRTSNLAINIFSATDPYQQPDDTFL